MKKKKTIFLVFGTRPEAIKMAPVALALGKSPSISVKICVTAQHREMLDQVLDLFDITPDFDLDLMRPNQTLPGLSSQILQEMSSLLQTQRPDLVVVHGDTSTAFISALASFYEKIPVAHIEAGLRTGNIYSPWPEEGNRKLISALASLHFAPTEASKKNLTDEGISSDSIYVTGNTVIDALILARNKIDHDQNIQKLLFEKFSFLNEKKDILLMTGHRRENFGSHFENICSAVKFIANEHANLEIVYPVHLNPKVQAPVRKILSGIENVHLIEPLDYLPFVYLMMRCKLILTDSGGIQEEAPALGKPVLVTRDTTERPEAIEAGTVRLVGSSEAEIIKAVNALLTDQQAYESMSSADNPYGDGLASERILNAFCS